MSTPELNLVSLVVNDPVVFEAHVKAKTSPEVYASAADLP